MPTSRDQTAARRAPPLRIGNQPDALDPQRIHWARHWRWGVQDDALRPFQRQVEENVRMLCGQQWHQWSQVLGRYVDVSRFLSERERRWRQFPVLNRVLSWYIITHARMTENSPIVTFVPGPDRIDALTAETLDIIFKTLWRELGMIGKWDRVAAWMAASGRGLTLTRIDLTKGDLKPWIADEAEVPVVAPDGTPMGSQVMAGVPVTKTGTPAIVLTPDGPMQVEQPHSEPEGGFSVDVLSPLEARAEWGPTEWHEKRWHSTRLYLTPAQFYDAFGFEVAPDTTALESENASYAQRTLFGSGWFGSQDGRDELVSEQAFLKEGFIEVTSVWEAPCATVEGMQRTEESPGGRYLVTTKKQVVIDGPRPCDYPYTSPLRCWDFVSLVGRPIGSTPLEALCGPQRAYNLGIRQILEHRNLTTNPKLVVDSRSGLEPGQITNRPGENLKCTFPAGVQKPVYYLAPPPLSEDVYRTQQILREEILELGNLRGTEGAPPTESASGELVKELRFNTDRFLGATLRRAAEEFARWAEDLRAMVPKVWTEEKVLHYAGEDNIARTLTVYPDLFRKGKVNVVADTESMLAEGRGERMARVERAWLAGVFGPPDTPQARAMYLELGRFPHLSRLAKPGGPHRAMAEQENGELMRGALAATLSVFEWQDHLIHLEIHEHLMASPEFAQYPPEVQQEFAAHRLAHVMFVQMAQARAMEQAAAMARVQGGAKQQPKMEDGKDFVPEGADAHRTGDEPAGRFPTAAGVA